MSGIPKLNETSFQDEVIEAVQPVLVDFTAVWLSLIHISEPTRQESRSGMPSSA